MHGNMNVKFVCLYLIIVSGSLTGYVLSGGKIITE